MMITFLVGDSQGVFHQVFQACTPLADQPDFEYSSPGDCGSLHDTRLGDALLRELLTDFDLTLVGETSLSLSLRTELELSSPYHPDYPEAFYGEIRIQRIVQSLRDKGVTVPKVSFSAAHFRVLLNSTWEVFVFLGSTSYADFQEDYRFGISRTRLVPDLRKRIIKEATQIATGKKVKYAQIECQLGFYGDVVVHSDEDILAVLEAYRAFLETLLETLYSERSVVPPTLEIPFTFRFMRDMFT